MDFTAVLQYSSAIIDTTTGFGWAMIMLIGIIYAGNISTCDSRHPNHDSQAKSDYHFLLWLLLIILDEASHVTRGHSEAVRVIIWLLLWQILFMVQTMVEDYMPGASMEAPSRSQLHHIIARTCPASP